MSACVLCGNSNFLGGSQCNCSGSVVYSTGINLENVEPIGRSQHRCPSCSNILELFEVCDCYTTPLIIERIDTLKTGKIFPDLVMTEDLEPSNDYGDISKVKFTLEDLYKELGSLYWTGSDSKCRETVEAIRTIIRDSI